MVVINYTAIYCIITDDVFVYFSFGLTLILSV